VVHISKWSKLPAFPPLFSLFQGGREATEKRPKNGKKGQKIALLSLYLLYFYHVWKSRGAPWPPAADANECTRSLKQNFYLNMPKNSLFLLKNRKNRRALGFPPPDPLPPAAAWEIFPRPPASGGWGLRFQTPVGFRRLGDPPPAPYPMTNSWLRALIQVMPKIWSLCVSF